MKIVTTLYVPHSTKTDDVPPTSWSNQCNIESALM